MINTALLMATMVGAGYFNSPRLTNVDHLSMREFEAISEAFEQIGVSDEIINYEDLDLTNVGVEIIPPHCDVNWVYHEEIYSFNDNEVVVVYMTNGDRYKARVLG